MEQVAFDHTRLEIWKSLLTQGFAAPPKSASVELLQAIRGTVDGLDKGVVRIAEKTGTTWQVNDWAKMAILLWFRYTANIPMEENILKFYDKVPVKTQFENVRVVPPGVARYGSYLAPGTILMPGYVNIGAYVDTGSMIDTWATVGSCAQIGKNVHLSGGVGIGGVLEPPQGKPVIIEDGAFIGSRCIIVEGVHVGSEAVIGAGVTITASTKIIDVSGSQEKIYQGEVPARSVVIPGTRPKEFPAGTYHTPCALIIGQRKESTNLKTSLNDVLRTFDVTV